MKGWGRVGRGEVRPKHVFGRELLAEREGGGGPVADKARTFYDVEAKNFQKKHSVASSL